MKSGILNKIAAVSMAITVAGAAAADGHRSSAAEDANAYFIAPMDNATLSNPVTILFGLEGMGVAPAGAEFDNTGHFHLLINTDPDSIDYDTSLPATDQIVHFGGGQTQVTTDLPAGTHTLQLLMGDWSHVPHDPPVMSEIITVTVQ